MFDFEKWMQDIETLSQSCGELANHWQQKAEKAVSAMGRRVEKWDRKVRQASVKADRHAEQWDRKIRRASERIDRKAGELSVHILDLETALDAAVGRAQPGREASERIRICILGPDAEGERQESMPELERSLAAYFNRCDQAIRRTVGRGKWS